MGRLQPVDNRKVFSGPDDGLFSDADPLVQYGEIDGRIPSDMTVRKEDRVPHHRSLFDDHPRAKDGIFDRPLDMATDRYHSIAQPGIRAESGRSTIRRPAFGLALLLSFLSTLLVFKFMRQLEDLYWMLPIMGFGQLSVFGVYAVYLPELFPTSLRSTGTSFCYNVGRFLAATAPFTVSQITKRLGGDIEGFRTAGMWVSLVLLIGIAVLPFLPETKGQPLPEE